MGKSAGKWIKTVLFGKKHSKSNYSKNGTPNKKGALKSPVEDPARDSSFIPDQLTERGVEKLELEKGTSASQCGAVGVAYVDQGIDSPKNDELAPVSDEEAKRQEQAATKTQAVFRGYLARRAFRALKGIIRLQALIRGHLVRRQAVATLRSMRAIVKFQALARGRSIRLSDDIPEVGKVELQVAVGAHSGSFLGSEMLASHPFIQKLLATLPNAMPLSLQYDPAEPNSAQNWLERWSLSRFWEPPVRTKKTMKSKPQRKPESEHVKSKRTIRKVSTTAHGENGGVASSEMDKPKRVSRKVTSQTEVAQEQSPSELERVKRNLRKVSASALAAPEKPDPEIEKPQPLQSVEIVASPVPPAVVEQEMVISPENPLDSDIVADQTDSTVLVEAPEKITKDEPVDVQHDNYPIAETPSRENSVKIESAPSLDDEINCKDEQNHKENPKIRKRKSLPANKPDYLENISQNSPNLPSYMAATESAKAKLRAQGAAAAKLAEEAIDYGSARRHSLPAPTNGKLTSLSPRIQKPVHANGKGSKVNKSLSASRDDKVVQPGWRR
ncbi:protein IQ-DOMAIN 31-like [Salvia splendens]|uniref:protein IQ-DOMAIN 31-like n=1 Tax=Salvia splendens TaxID=180675 RepID=UPI001C264CDF|nr:protein IQ-DOMAIN 31-like [Salvia splendens]XP_042024068.1 protein IQ-DOMAIN 31-like [Salvia splendens]XP_042024069.1 protein IQ-DOMAIN 31-like [Salvia splendens]XP_042024070.1 protein IQ-DOMAIN 31-like [Salvia splendens]XP_042024071.1 protein IQ-DOMAIN 31-like [Salvia splendens]XP_042024072.1 protein IQ-DOMAIN 31-like [Salvia splendens]